MRARPGAGVPCCLLRAHADWPAACAPLPAAELPGAWRVQDRARVEPWSPAAACWGGHPAPRCAVPLHACLGRRRPGCCRSDHCPPNSQLYCTTVPQNLVMYGTFRLAQKMPGGEKMVRAGLDGWEDEQHPDRAGGWLSAPPPPPPAAPAAPVLAANTAGLRPTTCRRGDAACCCLAQPLARLQLTAAHANLFLQTISHLAHLA